MVGITEEIWKSLSEKIRGRIKTSICVSTPTSNDSFFKRCLSNKASFDSMKEAYIGMAKAMREESIGISMDECTEAFIALGETCGESTANVSMFGDEFTNLYLGEWHENKINTRCSSHDIEFCFTCKCKAIKRFERRILRGPQRASLNHILH